MTYLILTYDLSNTYLWLMYKLCKTYDLLMREFLINLSWLATVFSELEYTILSKSLNKSSNFSEYESNLCKHDVYMTPNLSTFVLFFPFFVGIEKRERLVELQFVMNWAKTVTKCTICNYPLPFCVGFPYLRLWLRFKSL